MEKPTPEVVAEAIREHGSIRKASPALGVARSTVQDWIAEWSADPRYEPLFKAARHASQKRAPQAEQRAGVTIKGDEAVATSEPIYGKLENVRQAEEYLRKRWGLPEDEWLCLSITPNEWQGPVSGGGVATYSQVKGTFRKVQSLGLLEPANKLRPFPRRKVSRPAAGPWQAFVMGDEQLPYMDEGLHAASLAAIRDVQPRRIVGLGDTCDFPTISKHPDHPAALATPKECLESGHMVWRDRRSAAPEAEIDFMEGNHDWRIRQELLLRAERMAFVAPAFESVPAMSMRRLLKLDLLDINYVEDPRGWQHNEVELVPGNAGLVVRHGWLTGANSAEKSMKKRGRSIIVGHGHSREMVYAYNADLGVERQAAMLGTMSKSRHVEFPHFAVCDDWLQGFGIVTIWPSGEFTIEHARWVPGRQTLYWRDRAWRASDGDDLVLPAPPTTEMGVAA